ncbi:MAG: TolC family protein [Muribaculaceae bacterium]|nr:TolC family protein [Muribaculaceae bacterium]
MFRKFTYLAVALAAVAVTPAAAQTSQPQVYTLEQCRALALENNKELMAKRQSLKKAEYQKKEAFAAYLPAFDFAGGYFYNQKEVSVIGEDQHLPVQNFNLETQKYEFSVVKNPVTGQPVTLPDGSMIPQQTALLPKSALTYDIHNVFFGAVTLTQPIFMGGKIVAMNKLADINTRINENMLRSESQNVVYAVDAAYWTLVSLHAKHELATSYVNLLDSLDRNVALMVDAGVATRSDKLSVDVKLNEANVDLLKVENGLSLARMALAQVCGLPVNSQMHVADENAPAAPSQTSAGITSPDMQAVYADRPDLQALQLGIDAREQQANVARADMMPNVVLTGMYSFSNPNMFNGFQKRFDGAFSVGVLVKIPLWHWGGNYNKYRAAKTDAQIMRMNYDNAREMIDLQVNQASYKAQEARKTLDMTNTNMAKADENLRTAQVGFKEGVITADDVMAAQTAWLKANSELIDAAIEVRLCDVYLQKVLGTLQ